MNDETKSDSNTGFWTSIPWHFLLRYFHRNLGPIAIGMVIAVGGMTYLVLNADFFKGRWFGHGSEAEGESDPERFLQEELVKALTKVVKPALSEVDKTSLSQEKLDEVAKELQILNSKLPVALDALSDKLDRVISNLMSIKYNDEQDAEVGSVQVGGSDLGPSTLAPALLDLDELEKHINRWGSIKIDTAPEVMVLRIQIILRHLNRVHRLGGDRDSTSYVLHDLQRWLNQNGYANIPLAHHGYFGKKTIRAIRSFLMDSSKVACRTSGGGCYGTGAIN